MLQAKLTVNTPGDKYEQEADRVADMVMRMPEPTIQRECATCGGKSRTGGECPECKKKKQGLGGSLQRLSTHGDSAAGMAAPPIVSRVLSSSGSPLPTDTRAFMEARFGQSFEHVRFHAGSLAQESASAVQARAYTVGNNIVFGQGESPQNNRRLLAHELTHVVQQQEANQRTELQRQVIRTKDGTYMTTRDPRVFFSTQRAAQTHDEKRECEQIHATYHNLRCTKCVSTDPVREKARKVACFDRVIEHRSKFLAKGCDFKLDGSKQVGSVGQSYAHSEAIHQVINARNNCRS